MVIYSWHDLTGMWRHKEDPPTYSIHDVTTSTGIWDESYEEEMDYEIDSCWEVVEDDFTEKGGWVSASDWTRLVLFVSTVQKILTPPTYL